MSLRINTNIPAMTALRNLGAAEGQFAKSIERLGSGLRINTAADDPAGLIISEQLRAQIKGTERAMQNAQDAVNMAKTAEAALDEVQTLLRNIRALAVHSANSATIDAAQLQANQTQIRSVLQSIDRIAEHTRWGNKVLLDGTAGAMANVTNPAMVASMYFGSTFNNESLTNGPITLTRTTSAERATLSLAKTFAFPTTVATAGAFVINGYSFTSDGSETYQSLVAKINGLSNTTGVTAQIVGTGPNLSVRLDSVQYGAQFKVDLVDPSGILHTAPATNDVGVDAVFSVQATTLNGVQTVTFTGGRGPKESGLLLKDLSGNAIMLTENGNLGMGSATQVGVMSVGNVRFQIGAFANQSVSFSMPVVFANRLGTGAIPNKSLADVDVTSQQGATEAIQIIDAAISELAQRRGDLGSFQQYFLESTVRSLDVAKENMTASESTIRDVDMAEEMTRFTRVQILKQSGMAVLAQANQAPADVLALLRGI